MANSNQERVPMKIDSGDSSSAAVPDPFAAFTGLGMTKLEEKSASYASIKNFFIKGMGSAGPGPGPEVVAIHKTLSNDPMSVARYRTFGVFQKMLAEKIGGKVGFRDCWYGGSKAEIGEVLVHGFSGRRMAAFPNDHSYGLGLHLNGPPFASDAAMWCVADESGLKHLLICRVAVGKMEKMRPGSNQSCPRNKEADTGVDDFINPRRYIVWNAHMNTHVFPVYMVSFKASQDVHQPMQEVAGGV